MCEKQKDRERGDTSLGRNAAAAAANPAAAQEQSFSVPPGAKGPERWDPQPGARRAEPGDGRGEEGRGEGAGGAEKETLGPPEREGPEGREASRKKEEAARLRACGGRGQGPGEGSGEQERRRAPGGKEEAQDRADNAPSSYSLQQIFWSLLQPGLK